MSAEAATLAAYVAHLADSGRKAASAYSDYLRAKRNGMCPIQRKHEKVRALLDAVKAGGERVIPEHVIHGRRS